jgi:hypothetical protein
MSLRRRALTIAAAALAVGAPAASAATPADGTLTLDEPELRWSGEAMGSAIQYLHYFQGEQVIDDCAAPFCDTFTLTLADPGNLEISVEDASGYTEVQIKDEEGNELFWSGGDDGVPTTYVEYEAEPGTYTVEVLTDALAPAPLDDPSYSATAKYFVDEEPPAEEEGEL